MPVASQNLTFSQLGEYMRAMGQEVQALDFTPALRTAAAYLESKVRQNFDEGHAPDGTPWAPLLNPSRRRGANPKILVDTGKMFASVFSEVVSSEAIVSAAGVRVGIRADYASFHQEGTSRMVARPPLGVTPEQEAVCADIFLDFAARQMGKAA